jgi:hypothetical protein
VWAVVKSVLLVVGSFALLVFALREQQDTLADLLHGPALFETGAPAKGAEVEGTEHSTNAILNRYELNVRYRDREGGAHQGKVEFTLLFGWIGKGEPFTVHYDPQHPDDFVLSWAVSRLGRRWLPFVIGVLVTFAAWLLAGVAWPFATVQELRRWTLAASRSREVLLPIAKVITLTKGKKDTGKRQYVYQYGGRERIAEYPKGRAPLLDASGRALVALVPEDEQPPGWPLLLGSDLHPLVEGDPQEPAMPGPRVSVQ